MKKLVWSFLTTAILAEPSLSQEAIPFLDQLQDLSHAACIEVLEERTVLFDSVKLSLDQRANTLDFVLESNRLECEMVGVAAEIVRLEGEQGRLKAEIERLDGIWDVARGKNPRLKDFDGRRRSQEIMQSDIDRQSQTVRTLTGVVSNLRAQARRIFGLALATAEKAPSEELETINAADSADAQNDVLERILGTSRPRLAAALQL